MEEEYFGIEINTGPRKGGFNDKPTQPRPKTPGPIPGRTPPVERRIIQFEVTTQGEEFFTYHALSSDGRIYTGTMQISGDVLWSKPLPPLPQD